MTANVEKLKGNVGLADLGISLTSVSFSLWRAVFLADRSDIQGSDLSHAVQFLEMLISDNAISYVQDKTAREWTFIYYVNNARMRLMSISKVAEILPDYQNPIGDPTKATWEYLQNATDLAVKNFSKTLLKAK